VGKTDYDIHPEEIADIGYRLENHAIAEGRRVDQIQQLPAQDGTKRWINNRKYPINGPDGEIIGIFGVAPDVTQYVEAQLKLRESEESLREAQTIAGLSSYVLDIPAKVWNVAPELDALLGIDADYDHAFEGIWPLIHPDDRATMAERFERHFRGESMLFDSEYRIVRHTDGAVRWVHTRGRLELDAQGKPFALRGTVHDITERKQAEAALIESRTKLEAALASMTDAVLISDTEGRLIEFNDAFAAFHKFKSKAECGTTVEGVRSLLELLLPSGEPPPMETRPVLRALRGETGTDVEYTLRRIDTGEAWIGSYSFAPIRDKDGAIVGAVTIARDITEKKRADTALRESKDLLQLFIDRAPAALAMLDREMRYLAVSQRWLEDYSLAVTKIIGRCHYEIFPDLPERWKEAHRRGLAGETLKCDEDRFERADGTVHWLRWEIAPWRRLCGRHCDFRREHYGAQAGRGTASSRRERLYRRARRHRDHRCRRDDPRGE
jgi:PAS domain S-box-containing protein